MEYCKAAIDSAFDDIAKGAVSARKGEYLVIPMNMRDGILLCSGYGDSDWNYSAPHGAGRLYSRNVAKKTLSIDEFKSEMNGIWSSCVSESTLDESPMAYKSMEDIVDAIGSTVKIIDVFKTVYNFKG